MLLSEEDHERVRKAVDDAEARTSGEIVCVLAGECSDYWEVPLVWAIGVALVVPPAAFFLARHWGAAGVLGAGWTAAHAAAAEAATGQVLDAYAVIQAVLFIVTALVVSIPPVRRALTPGALKREHVHRRAVELFAARAYHLTEGHTGVLVFAALAERRAIVLADDGVASRVAPSAWSDVVNDLIKGMKARDPAAGFVAAIRRAADILAEHCPRPEGHVSRLPDTVIEIDH